MKKFLTAFLMAIGLSASYSVIGKSHAPAVAYSAILKNPTLMLFTVIGLYLFLTYKHKISYATNGLQKIVAFFFAYCTWSIMIYQSDNKTISQILVHHPFGVLFSLLTIGSYFILLNSAQGIMTYYYMRPEKIHIKQSKRMLNVTNQFSKRPFLVAFLILFGVWFFIACTSFPGVHMGDSLDQIEQVFGYTTRTAAHPVLSTLFIGGFVKLGSLLGSSNLGAFMFTVVQLLIVSALIAYSIKLINDVTHESFKLLCVTVLLALLPSVNGVVILATKDIVFSGFFVLYLTTLAIYLLNSDFFFQQKLWLLEGISIVFMILFRYNTLHFLLLSLVVFLVAELIGKKKIIRKQSIIPIMLLSFVVGLGINKGLVYAFAEEEPTPQWQAMLSIPFQHTARYVTYHEDELSEKDKEIINSVMSYQKIKQKYNPTLSDPVRRTFKKNATSEEKAAYFKLVGKQVVTHPLLALETLTTMHGNLFNVNHSLNWYYGNTVVLDGDTKGMMKRYNKVGLSDNKVFLKLNEVRMFVYLLWDRLPIFSQLDNYGFYLFVFLSLFVLSLRKKRYDLAGMFIPLGAFVGTLILGPVTQGYLRFELPIMLMTPLLVILFYANTSKVNKA